MKVVRLGALLDLDSNDRIRWRGFKIREFADLDNGRRVFWRTDRGWGRGPCSDDEWPVSSGRDMAAEVMEATGGCEQLDLYVSVAGAALHEMGEPVDAASVWVAPYVVEFSEDLRAEMERVSRTLV